MSIGVIISLIIIGILLLLVEFLVVPGVTVAGVAGTVLILGGVIAGYYFHESPVNHLILLSTLGFILIVFIIAFKTKTWRKMGLKSTIASHVDAISEDAFKVGDIGKTISKLAPIGKVMVNDIVVEARSLGSYIDSNKEIVIIRKEKNKLFVEPK